jgi:lipopolysaccharide cholinephosphotransferase
MREFTDITKLTWPELRDLQLAELNNLLHLDKICRANNIRYTLGGGSCIGALREGGFIEWDDDIDVWIPRPDYERLHEIWDDVNDDPHMHLCRSTVDRCYHINCSFIRDDRTTFINRHSVDEDINHGVSIDIMPMDGAPANFFSRVDQAVCAMLFCLYGAGRLPDHQGGAIRALAHIPLALVRDTKRRMRISQHFEKRMTRWSWDECPYAKELCTGFKIKFKKMPRAWFDTSRDVPFEGHPIEIAAGAEHYMELLFGDYMQRPPESERGPKHRTVYVNLDEPYLKFKGVYYCVNGAEAPEKAEASDGTEAPEKATAAEDKTAAVEG